MSFVSRYKYDIFISYARGDNKTTRAGESGWVDHFHKELEVLLGKHLGRAGLVKIGRDGILDANGGSAGEDHERIDEPAVFLSLASPSYLRSECCKNELDLFHEKARSENKGFSFGERLRIFNVLMYNMPCDNLPGALKGANSFKFYDDKSHEDIAPPLILDDIRYYNRLTDLGWSILTMLESLKKINISSPLPADESQEKTFDIFLADVSDSLRKTRRRVIADMEQRGIKVYRDVPPPHGINGHEEAVKSAVENSILSVHLLDGETGTEMEEKNKTYPHEQLELGKRYSSGQLIWVPKHLELDSIEDDRQRGLLGDLERGGDGNRDYDFLRGVTGEISQLIIEKLTALQKDNKEGNAHPAVLLDTHIKDQSLVLDISRHLIQNDIFTYMNPHEDNPLSKMKLFKERLQKVDAVVIVYGHVSKEWVLARISEAVKTIIAESFSAKPFYVYVAPPEKGAEGVSIKLPFVNLSILDNSNGFNPLTLEPLVNRLEGMR